MYPFRPNVNDNSKLLLKEKYFNRQNVYERLTKDAKRRKIYKSLSRVGTKHKQKGRHNKLESEKSSTKKNKRVWERLY
jgi:hypothetical protein